MFFYRFFDQHIRFTHNSQFYNSNEVDFHSEPESPMKNLLSDSTTLLNLHVIRHPSASSLSTAKSQLNSCKDNDHDDVSRNNIIRLKNHSKNGNKIMHTGIITSNQG